MSAAGISVDLPPGWEGAVTHQRPIDPAELQLFQGAPTAGPQPSAPLPALHIANFPLPPDRADFGAGAVEAMGAAHVFVALVEFGPESVRTALFARQGVPRSLRPEEFHPQTLQRTLPRQAGRQVFCTEATRAFCLYAVLGERLHAPRLVGEVNRVLATLRIAGS